MLSIRFKIDSCYLIDDLMLNENDRSTTRKKVRKHRKNGGDPQREYKNNAVIGEMT